MRNLLNLVGQSFVTTGFVFFLLAIPLYYVYPPLYTSVEEHANNLVSISVFGLFWTLFGLYPVLLSIAIKEINIGDLVSWQGDTLMDKEMGKSSIGIVVEKDSEVPIGWFNEDGDRETACKYKVFWQDLRGCGWHWEEDISHYEEDTTSDK